MYPTYKKSNYGSVHFSEFNLMKLEVLRSASHQQMITKRTGVEINNPAVVFVLGNVHSVTVAVTREMINMLDDIFFHPARFPRLDLIPSVCGRNVFSYAILQFNIFLETISFFLHELWFSFFLNGQQPTSSRMKFPEGVLLLIGSDLPFLPTTASKSNRFWSLPVAFPSWEVADWLSSFEFGW